MDPSYDIPDGVQKAAEHVVREVIKEVHGPFFNSEVSRHVSRLILMGENRVTGAREGQQIGGRLADFGRLEGVWRQTCTVAAAVQECISGLLY